MTYWVDWDKECDSSTTPPSRHIHVYSDEVRTPKQNQVLKSPPVLRLTAIYMYLRYLRYIFYIYLPVHPSFLTFLLPLLISNLSTYTLVTYPSTNTYLSIHFYHLHHLRPSLQSQFLPPVDINSFQFLFCLCALLDSAIRPPSGTLYRYH
ncbi:uncharacterized protein GGS22DRAFT_127151 [Annulohypoxylon maeteangense]|uniref:uncharacterized protein n=1 Tax=Annulohypoxylon maeteangense TaxID=1927788 RepID=UPI002007B7F4|nr:uncharacterized protein GGS22DRAFT_127151 [Annulohypoxylon maeteangense]KAI0886301.1 hypothetical protein GGS22DRAFT_127151 [Annulohypoxylon maeteangense]